jgi:putative membrane protein
MKLFGILALLLGLLAGTLLIAHYGFDAVATALLTIGWEGFLAILVIHLATLALCGLSWFVLVPSGEHKGPWPFVWGRLVREGGSELLPLSQLGGLVMGGRAASLAGLPGRISAASSVVDATIELLAQLAFAASGLGLLVLLRPDAPFIAATAAALAAALVGIIFVIIFQQRGFVLLERIAERLSRQWSNGGWSAGTIQHVILQTYERHGRLLTGFLLHLLAWIAGAIEIWIALMFMGRPLPLAAVIVIEGLLAAARGIAFVVPSALGVQEGVYLVLGGLFGLPPDTALALSLLKRARGLVLGAPPLLLWQIAESRQLLRLRRTAAAASSTGPAVQAPQPDRR